MRSRPPDPNCLNSKYIKPHLSAETHPLRLSLTSPFCTKPISSHGGTLALKRLLLLLPLLLPPLSSTVSAKQSPLKPEPQPFLLPPTCSALQHPQSSLSRLSLQVLSCFFKRPALATFSNTSTPLPHIPTTFPCLPYSVYQGSLQYTAFTYLCCSLSVFPSNANITGPENFVLSFSLLMCLYLRISLPVA